jgi:hypothetical protein
LARGELGSGLAAGHAMLETVVTPFVAKNPPIGVFVMFMFVAQKHEQLHPKEISRSK